MTEHQPLSGSTVETETTDSDDESDLPTFKIGLFPTGDAGSSFRTENDHNDPYQRSNVIERKGDLDVRCSCKDVIHGLFSAEDEAFATLIVLDFEFYSRKQARRLKSASIAVEFMSQDVRESGPEVYAITPSGRVALHPTRQHEEVKKNASLQLGGAAPVGGLTATGTVGWEKSVGQDKSDQTTVTGTIDLMGRNWGKSNHASWTLLENNTTKSGIPSNMRAAILLKRKDESMFQCTVEIAVNVDFASKVDKLMGRKGKNPKDDPVLFDPEMKPTNKLRKYDVDNLGFVDLESIQKLT